MILNNAKIVAMIKTINVSIVFIGYCHKIELL